jgi:hypothetical protein
VTVAHKQPPTTSNVIKDRLSAGEAEYEKRRCLIKQLAAEQHAWLRRRRDAFEIFCALLARGERLNGIDGEGYMCSWAFDMAERFNQRASERERQRFLSSWREALSQSPGTTAAS